MSKKTEQLIHSLLDLSDIEDQESQNKDGRKYVADASRSIIKQEAMAENEAKPHNSLLAVTYEMLTTDVIDVEEITCSLAKKKTKLDTECIIMGGAYRFRNQCCTTNA